MGNSRVYGNKAFSLPPPFRRQTAPEHGAFTTDLNKQHSKEVKVIDGAR
jgi:hypothetical protein